MIRILLVTPDLLDNQSWWRSSFPLADIESDGSGRIIVNSPGSITDLDLRRASLVYVQRPWDVPHVELVKASKRNGRPTIVEFDDLLWNIPFGNPSRKQYTQERIDAATQCALLADWCIVSTEALADHLIALGCERVTVAPNALPSWMPWPKRAERAKTIWWRGGSYHTHDIETVVDELVDVVNERPDWKLILAGSTPVHIVNRIANRERVECLEPLNINAYHDRMVAERPWCVINPLEDHPFNRCKSNIGWIEASLAGAVCVVPDFPEFQRPGALIYRPGGFGAVLRMALHMPSIDAHVEHARAFIDQHLRLDNINERRMQVIQAVLSSRSSSSKPEAPDTSLLASNGSSSARSDREARLSHLQPS